MFSLNFLNVMREPWSNRINLFWAKKRPGKIAVVTDLIFTEYEAEGSTILDPKPIQIDEASAQQFMDALWHAGIRPTEGAGTAGSMSAVQKHLEDMRALVFGLDVK